jgi:hypothetical protein
LELWIRLSAGLVSGIYHFHGNSPAVNFRKSLHLCMWFGLRFVQNAAQHVCMQRLVFAISRVWAQSARTYIHTALRACNLLAASTLCELSALALALGKCDQHNVSQHAVRVGSTANLLVYRCVF